MAMSGNPYRCFRPAVLASALLLTGGAGLLLAQDQQDSSDLAAMDDSSRGSFEVLGVDVDVSARNAKEARMLGFREAQRRGWKMLFTRMTGQPQSAAPSLSDTALDALVSAIVVEREQVGSTRYIARLGVQFDRGRAGQLLGVKGQVMRSPPMLMIPVLIEGGAAQSFEARTPWLKAWARFRAGGSAIDYIRPLGSGADPLLLSYAQSKRPNREWWLTVLDQYGASDVLVAETRLERAFPGGPVVAHFVARHGPDGDVLGRFALKTGAAAGLEALLDEGVRRIDMIYTQALRSGQLKPDPKLRFDDVPDIDLSISLAPQAAIVGAQGVEVTVETPDADAVQAIERAIRRAYGVTGTMVTSLSLGGNSRIQISYGGDLATLRWALDQQGWRIDGDVSDYRLRKRRSGEAAVPRPISDDESSAVAGDGDTSPQNLLVPEQ